MEYHNPVLLQESIDGLNIQPDGIYVDVTFGGGGHSRAILQALGPNGRLFSFDQDPDAQANIPDDPRLTFVPQNFRYLTRFLKFYGIQGVDGILGDLGVSSHQFDVAERGFTIRADAPLDMRMNPGLPLSAADILNTYEESQLAKLLHRYGDVPQAHKVSRAICSVRDTNPVTRVSQLLEILEPFTPKFKGHKFHAQVFQALRIEVNQEIEALKEMLENGRDMLNPGGRFCIISYHSLEDRLVKQFFREGILEGEAERDFFGNRLVPFNLITRKPIDPTEEEIARNSRARSAHLRIAEKKAP